LLCMSSCRLVSGAGGTSLALRFLPVFFGGMANGVEPILRAEVVVVERGNGVEKCSVLERTYMYAQGKIGEGRKREGRRIRNFLDDIRTVQEQ
jgi:hypothetical protein